MLVLQSCILDLSRLTLRNGNNEAALTRIETRLLALLGARVEQWVSERTVLQIVWDEPSDMLDQTSKEKVEAKVAIKVKADASVAKTNEFQGTPTVIMSGGTRFVGVPSKQRLDSLMAATADMLSKGTTR